MPDITMCTDSTCPLFDKCFRAQAIPDDFQSFFRDSPRNGDKCNYYLEDRYVRIMGGKVDVRWHPRKVKT